MACGPNRLSSAIISEDWAFTLRRLTGAIVDNSNQYLQLLVCPYLQKECMCSERDQYWQPGELCPHVSSTSAYGFADFPSADSSWDKGGSLCLWKTTCASAGACVTIALRVLSHQSCAMSHDGPHAPLQPAACMCTIRRQKE